MEHNIDLSYQPRPKNRSDVAGTDPVLSQLRHVMLCLQRNAIIPVLFFLVISNELVWTGGFRVSEDEWLRSTWHEAFWEPGRHHQSIFKHLNYSPYIIICTYISICLTWLGTKHKRVLWLRCNARHDVYCFFTENASEIKDKQSHGQEYMML